MSFKEFLAPDWKRMIVYLILVLIFLAEILIVRSVQNIDYIVVFVLNLYQIYSAELVDYSIDFFAVTFFFYIFILFILYLLGCLIVFIINKIKK